MYMYLYMWLYLCGGTCVFVRVRVCGVCMCALKVDAECLTWLFSTLFTEAGSFTKPEVNHFGQLG